MLAKALLFAALVTPLLHANNGQELYSLYCGACHGAEGEGAMDGQFPPLANSAWPLGDPDRSIKIVLGGLHGPIEINGNTWNLEMPPQGAMLSDEQIAAILTYVRSSWGNDAAPVDAERVKTVRAATANRKEYWTAAVLLEQHPLEIAPPIGKLVARYYEGKWSELPDFGKLTATSSEEVSAGLVSLEKSRGKNHFGYVWEGTLDIPEDGEYEFYLGADDGGRILIDGNVVAKILDRGPVKGRDAQGSVSLKKGPNPLRVEYFEFDGEEDIFVGWRKKDSKGWRWLSDKRAASPGGAEMLVEPDGKRPAIYRNFIKGVSPRGIGFGLPSGVNFAWSADHYVPELIWIGKFMNGAHHWTERGEGAQPPAGERVVQLSENLMGIVLSSETSSGWPKETRLSPTFRGYQIDQNGIPTFATQIGESRILDTYSSNSPTVLTRTIRLTQNPSAPVSILLAKGDGIKAEARGKWSLPSNVSMEVKGVEAQFKNNTLMLQPSAGATITITYTWK